jgi:hypothetical protein
LNGALQWFMGALPWLMGGYLPVNLDKEFQRPELSAENFSAEKKIVLCNCVRINSGIPWRHEFIFWTYNHFQTVPVL